MSSSICFKCFSCLNTLTSPYKNNNQSTTYIRKN
nr:MAG TPA: hypothetical protein [Caudoviricetes sp.]